MPVQNAEIAAMFDQTADLLELRGKSLPRARLSPGGADRRGPAAERAHHAVASGCDLSELPGIGKDLAGKIADIVRTGHFQLLDSLKTKVPGQIGDMAALPGLGPKRLKLLYDKLKLRTLDDLRRAAKEGRLAKVRGFGPTIVSRLVEALEKPVPGKRFKLSMAEAEADSLLAYLQERGARIAVAGSYRRRRDTVGDLDMLAARDDGDIAAKFLRYENVAKVLAHGTTRAAVLLRSGLQVDLRVVPPESYGAALLYFTGSKAHNIALRGLA